MSLIDGQMMTLVISLFGIVVWVVWMRQNPKHKLTEIGIVPIMWFAHNSVLYASLIFFPTKLSSYQYAIWTQIARLHIAFTILVIGYTLLHMKGGNK